MSTALAKTETLLDPKVIESLVVRGDLSQLSPLQKAQHYTHVCERLGLDPATQPFAYLKLNGKEIMYAQKACTDQLRKLHGITITITSRELVQDLYVVTARASCADGRSDEDMGAVTVGSAKGDNLANAMMKAHTKAKRRVTLSIVGLGMLDESELETIPRERMDAIPQELPRGEVIVQGEPTTSTRQLRPAEKRGEAIPSEHLTSQSCIPPSIILAIGKAWEHLGGIRVCDMEDADLELVCEHAPRARGIWAQRENVSENALTKLMELERIAGTLLDERHGGAA